MDTCVEAENLLLERHEKASELTMLIDDERLVKGAIYRLTGEINRIDRELIRLR